MVVFPAREIRSSLHIWAAMRRSANVVYSVEIEVPPFILIFLRVDLVMTSERDRLTFRKNLVHKAQFFLGHGEQAGQSGAGGRS